MDIYRNTLQEPSGRVCGGEDAQRHQFPYQASILWGLTLSDLEHNCGGTLIAKRWVLTAAHCKQGNGEYQIKLGQLNQGENHSDVQVFKVLQFIAHEGYTGIGSRPGTNDIAVIELDRDAYLTDAVQIAPLATEEQCNDISNSVVSGWGLTENGYPVTLQWATIPRITNKECARLGSSSLLDDTMICTKAKPGNPQSSCGGDSGGPLVLEKDYSLIGVVSWGNRYCSTEGKRSVYTRVCSHRDFINKYVK